MQHRFTIFVCMFHLAITISVYYENNASSARKFTIFFNAIFLFWTLAMKSLTNKETIKKNRAMWYEKLEWAFSN